MSENRNVRAKRKFCRMDSVAVRLERLKREVQKDWRRKWRQKLRKAAPANAAEWRALGAQVLSAIGQVALIIALPFAVLVRGSVFIYEHGTRSVWLAVLTAAVLTAGVVTAYAVWMARKFTKRGGRGGRALVMPLAKWVALPLQLFLTLPGERQCQSRAGACVLPVRASVAAAGALHTDPGGPRHAHHRHRPRA